MLHIELAAREVGLHINAKKTEYMSINDAGLMKSDDDQIIQEVLDFIVKTRLSARAVI